MNFWLLSVISIDPLVDEVVECPKDQYQHTVDNCNTNSNWHDVQNWGVRLEVVEVTKLRHNVALGNQAILQIYEVVVWVFEAVQQWRYEQVDISLDVGYEGHILHEEHDGVMFVAEDVEDGTEHQQYTHNDTCEQVVRLLAEGHLCVGVDNCSMHVEHLAVAKIVAELISAIDSVSHTVVDHRQTDHNQGIVHTHFWVTHPHSQQLRLNPIHTAHCQVLDQLLGSGCIGKHIGYCYPHLLNGSVWTETWWQDEEDGDLVTLRYDDLSLVYGFKAGNLK